MESKKVRRGAPRPPQASPPGQAAFSVLSSERSAADLRRYSSLTLAQVVGWVAFGKAADLADWTSALIGHGDAWSIPACRWFEGFCRRDVSGLRPAEVRTALEASGIDHLSPHDAENFQTAVDRLEALKLVGKEPRLAGFSRMEATVKELETRITPALTTIGKLLRAGKLSSGGFRGDTIIYGRGFTLKSEDWSIGDKLFIDGYAELRSGRSIRDLAFDALEVLAEFPEGGALTSEQEASPTLADSNRRGKGGRKRDQLYVPIMKHAILRALSSRSISYDLLCNDLRLHEGIRDQPDEDKVAEWLAPVHSAVKLASGN